MARERTENGSVSFLNGSIDDSTTTVAVTDSSVYSSLPQFRIIIDAEIMLVTAIAGNNLTVERGAEGTTAAAHSDGATVPQIITKEGVQRYNRDWCNPLFDDGNAKPMQLLDGSGNTLQGSNFTDINFGGSGTTTKTDMTSGPILLEKATQAASNSVAMIVRSAPTAPWILTVGFIPNLVNFASGDFPSVGPVVRENSSGEFYYFQYATNTNGSIRIQVTKHTSPTASSTSFLATENWSGPCGNVAWFQIEDDNTDLIFRFSADSVNFVELGREARLTFLTPDEIGFGTNNFGNPISCQGTLVAWDES